jgi:hypothetical protein
VPAAILGAADFDVTTVNATTLHMVPVSSPWGTLGSMPKHDLADPTVYADHLQNANPDAFTDLVSHHPQKDIGFVSGEGDTQACLRGDLTDGRAFEGCDFVIVK